jgi:hypothetical protein
MTSRERRFIAAIVPLVIATHLVDAQGPSRLDAGAGAGGSVFGWQPRIGIAGALQAASLGPAALSWHGSLDRVAAPSTSMYELTSGGRLFVAGHSAGWWLGGDLIRRGGFKDAVEQPRIETGGWRRIGNVVVTLSAARRSADMNSMLHFTRNVTSYYAYLDSITGRWDSTLVARTVGDSARIAEMRRWMETEAGVAWDGRRLSGALSLGSRLATRGVPRGAWGSATVAVRLSSPLSLVVGAGMASGGRFALDGEHRYVSLGLRIRPSLAPTVAGDRVVVAATTVSSFRVAPIGLGRYRLMIDAPRARRVEISGDFTSWKPMALARAADGRWTLTLPLGAGTHRLNARVDGGSWIVPPGLTTMSDDYAGEVGLLVIEAHEEQPVAPK